MKNFKFTYGKVFLSGFFNVAKELFLQKYMNYLE